MEIDSARELDENLRTRNLKLVDGWLKSSGLHFDFVDNTFFKLPFGNGERPVFVYVAVADTFLVVIANSRGATDPSKQDELLKLLNSWNIDRPLGSFELQKGNFVNYRYGIDAIDLMTPEAFAMRVFHCASVMESRVDELQPYKLQAEKSAS